MQNIPDSNSLLDSLSKPETYPDKPSSVEVMQTQMSFIFLTGKFAYKIKKPVNLGYLDYTKLENRKFFCFQELKLNQRLSPDVYIDVIQITERNGQIQLNGDGKIIEYCVKMKQLPQEKMLDVLLLHGKVTEDMLRQVSEKLAIFHKNAATSNQISAFGEIDAIMINIDENSSQTEKYIDISIPPFEYLKINEFNSDFTSNNKTLFDKRVKNRRIRDCHGDLHAAHVCFSNGVQIFDCIEFNDRFRYCDVASEIAFLAMDLERNNRYDLSKAFIDSYVKYSGDRDLVDLLNFYKCYRAYVRGKVESFKLDDRYMDRNQRMKALEAAKTYFHLAYGYTRNRPELIIMSGLVGTGKTTIAELIEDNIGFTVISTDIVRKTLAGIPVTEHHFDEFDTGLYSSEFTQKTYKEMFDRAREILVQGRSVILDASFKKKGDRQTAHRLAKETNSDFLVIECVLDKILVKNRLEARGKQSTASDGRWEIFETQKSDFDKIDEFTQQNHMVIDTSQPPGSILEKLLERI